MLEKIIALNTCHMPSATPDFGDLQVIKLESNLGFVVWPSYSGSPDHRIPEWILPIINFAWIQEATLILFDSECCQNPDFDMWEL